MSQATVYIADDHDLYRGGLVRAVSACDGLELAGEAADGATALQDIQRLDPDLALLDRRMPGMNGLEIAQALRDTGQHTRTLILTADVTAELLQAGREHGAVDVVSKSESRAAICDALLAAAAADAPPAPPRGTP